ncbi:MAG: hypothetical protein HOJ34_03395 [Kordiimonadaceae bacterium]|jgi:uncharacterized protein|nr:hypothetical protein [Kordiimonadaceae bacterium]MBT6035122.1 hypothetical protein [Kordiimonadaceae bacterium]MBT6328805.1 hypothetical protein [Kordiimonadaceae bacterium]MBT7583777.1 hypothetical protein [Kordiimonadaceae bacterium]
MTDSIIKYDELVQAALIGVVRDILIDTAEHGLPGEHHFYITFQTNHPGVNIPAYLKERYEEDMTIVLQNQFWDLFIDDEHFEISLSFNRNKELLYVPFDALLGFFDPSVDFGLHFNSDDEAPVELVEKEDITTSPIVEKKVVEDTDEKDNIVALDTFRKKK